MNIVQRNPAASATGRFAFSEAPIPGESLMGFIARNADIHGVDKVSSALLPAGLENPKTEAFATAYEGQADVLAALFMTTPEEMRSRMYLPWAGREGTEVNFHGTHVRPKYLRWRHRRFSPASLRVSGHHRAMWDLAVLSFCPESKEALVSGCPSCGESLGWRYTLGIGTCEWCEADLTEVAGVPVQCDDLEALDFVCDLVTPDQGKRDRAHGRTPERLSTLDTGELFELAVNLACLVLTKPEAASMVRLQFKQDMDVITPASLATAGRLILGWPESMHALAAKMRSQAHLRTGCWGAKKELRPMLWLTKLGTIAPVAREAIEEIIEANIGDARSVAQRVYNLSDAFMTKHEISKEFGFKGELLNRLCSQGLVQSISRESAGKPTILIRRCDVADLRAEMGDVTPRLHVARMLGVDYAAVERLAGAGLLRKPGAATAAALYGDRYRTSSLTGLRERLLALAEGHVGSEEYQTLLSVAASSKAPVVPWQGLIEAVLSHRLRVVSLSDDPELPLMERLGVPRHMEDLADALPLEALPERSTRFINTFEAGAILEVPASTITYVTQGGGLTRRDNGEHTLMINEVLDFRSRCIGTKEVARRIGNNVISTSWRLGRLKVPLAFASAKREVIFWRRSAAEAAFEDLRKG